MIEFFKKRFSLNAHLLTAGIVGVFVQHIAGFDLGIMFRTFFIIGGAGIIFLFFGIYGRRN